MTRAAYVADVHLANHRRYGGPVVAGLNHRARMISTALRRAAHTAEDAGADLFVVLGDLFDTVRPEPQIVRAAQEAFDSFSGQVVVLVGNHDAASTAPLDHACASLYGHAVVLDCPQWMHRPYNLCAIPFRPGPAEEWLPGVAAEIAEGKSHDAMAIHLGISDVDTPPWLRGASDSVSVDTVLSIAERHQIPAVFAGNWHHHASWCVSGVDIVQVGALVPTGYDNPGMDGYGSVVIHDAEKRDWWRIEVPGPRFIRVGGDQESEIRACIDAASRAGHSLFVRWEVESSGYDSARALIASWVESGDLAGGEAVMDRTEAKVGAVDAARSARRPSTLAGRIDQYIEAMVCDGVDRQVVRSRVRRYMGF